MIKSKKLDEIEDLEIKNEWRQRKKCIDVEVCLFFCLKKII